MYDTGPDEARNLRAPEASTGKTHYCTRRTTEYSTGMDASALFCAAVTTTAQAEQREKGGERRKRGKTSTAVTADWVIQQSHLLPKHATVNNVGGVSLAVSL